MLGLWFQRLGPYELQGTGASAAKATDSIFNQHLPTCEGISGHMKVPLTTKMKPFLRRVTARAYAFKRLYLGFLQTPIHTFPLFGLSWIAFLISCHRRLMKDLSYYLRMHRPRLVLRRYVRRRRDVTGGHTLDDF